MVPLKEKTPSNLNGSRCKNIEIDIEDLIKCMRCITNMRPYTNGEPERAREFTTSLTDRFPYRPRTFLGFRSDQLLIDITSWSIVGTHQLHARIPPPHTANHWRVKVPHCSYIN